VSEIDEKADGLVRVLVELTGEGFLVQYPDLG
jgi:hypothetical protein